MNKNQNPGPWPQFRTLAIVGAVSFSCLTALGQQYINAIYNPSFESNSFTTYPGYITGGANGPIIGWSATPTTAIGLNPASGSPFASDGAIPDGKNCAFIQCNSGTPSTLSTTMSNLVAGTTYTVSIRATSRASQYPHLITSIDGVQLLALTVFPVCPSGYYLSPWKYICFNFTATASTHVLGLRNDTTTDNTVCVDNIQVYPSLGKWAIQPWTSDIDCGVDPNYFYTHAYAFSASSNIVINGINFSPLAGANPAVPFTNSSPQLGLYPFTTVNAPNTHNDTRAGYITGASAGLAANFNYGPSTVPAGSYESINLTNLLPGTNYIFTVYSRAWEAPTYTNRWHTFSMGGSDRITTNQDSFGSGNGISISYAYTASSNGTASFLVDPVNTNNLTFHMYGFCNREALSRNVAAAVTVQPLSTVVSAGLSTTFTIAASGIPMPSYQWYFNGTLISGAQTNTYNIPAPDNTAIGSYFCVVSNIAGVATSHVATLNVGTALIQNPSFEMDSFVPYPGYVGSNGGGAGTSAGINFPITYWAVNNTNGCGLNPVSNGAGPFANNGAIPNGAQVAFLQCSGSTGILSQVVSNFNIGSDYCVHYYENCRSGYESPWLEVDLGGTNDIGGVMVLVPHPITAVGGANPYHEVFSAPFTATDSVLELDFVKSDPIGGDSTALIDNVAILAIPAGTAPYITQSPTSAAGAPYGTAWFWGNGVGSVPLSYQWLKNGVPISGATSNVLSLSFLQKSDDANYSFVVTNSSGSVTSAVAHLTVSEAMPNLFNTGVDNNHLPLGDGAADPHYTLIVDQDTPGTNSAVVQGIGTFPAPWVWDTAVSQWVGPEENTDVSQTGLWVYRTVLDLTGRDPNTLVIQGRWANATGGSVDLKINGISTGNAASTSASTYTAFALYATNTTYGPSLVAGPNNLDFYITNNAMGPTGLRVEFTNSNLKIPASTPASVVLAPLSVTNAILGQTITFTGMGSGSAPLSYQWYYNGAAIPGQTGLSLVLPNIAQTDAGIYTLGVTNAFGVAVSQPAALWVIYSGVPGVYGTGVNADGTLAPDASVDLHYILSLSADPTYVGPNASVVDTAYPIQPGTWALNGPNSKWIAPSPNQNSTASSANTDAAGNYDYQTTFDLTSYSNNLSQVQIIGGWATDNTGTDILVNGVSTGNTCPGFYNLTPFVITAANGLVAGPNILDFLVNNAGTTASPTGLRVNLYAVLPLPAPAAPAAPTGLSATAGNSKAVLSWNAATLATSYNVRRASVSGGPYTTVASGVTGLGYTVTNLANGMTWYFVVSAVDQTVEGANSTEVSAMPIASSQPTIGFGWNNGQFQLTWPADHLGWLLQAQTNGPGIGLLNYSTNWIVVPGSSTNLSLTVPINNANGSLFFRLVHP